MADHLEDVDLTCHSLDIVDILDLVFLEDLDGNSLISQLMYPQLDLAECPLSNRLVYEQTKKVFVPCNCPAFGRPVSGFQVTRHKLVDMATQIDIAREYTYRCAALMQAGKNPIKQVAMAKNFAVDVCEKVTREAVQLFGGMGYMRESVVERLYRDAKILSIGGGTTEIMKELIAKQIRL